MCAFFKWKVDISASFPHNVNINPVCILISHIEFLDCFRFLFSGYLVSACHISGSVLGTGNVSVSEQSRERSRPFGSLHCDGSCSLGARFVFLLEF